MSTSRIESMPVSQEKWLRSQKGMVFYNLRKTSFEVSVPMVVIRYEAFVKVPDKADKAVPEADYFKFVPDPRADKKATVTAIYEPDMEMIYGIDVEKVESAWQNTKAVKLALDDSGMLTSVNGEFEDKKADTIKNVIKTALDVARFASGVTLKSIDPGKIYKPKVLDGHAYAVTKVISAESLKGSATQDGSSTIYTNDFSDKIAGVAARAQSRLMLDPDHKVQFESSDGNGGLFRDADIGLKSLSLKVALPGGAAPTREAIKAELKGMQNDHGSLDGIVVQKPRTARVSLIVDEREVAQSNATLSDFAGVSLINVRGKSFADNKRSLTFSGSGGLKEYSASSTSQAQAVSGLVSEQTTGFLKANQEIEAAQQAEQKATATRVGAVHALDLEILKKQNEIDAVAAELDKAMLEKAANVDALKASLAVKKLELNNLEEKRRLTAMGVL